MVFVLIGLCLFCLATIGPGILGLPLMFAWELTTGWVGYLSRVLPHVQIAWGGVAVAIACLAGVLLIGHRFARWLWRETGPAAARRIWPLRWTISIVAVVVLMFVAGIASVGMTHQAAWLARSDQPFAWYGRGREKANQVKCQSNLRQIGTATLMFANDHQGRFPHSFAELLVAQELTPELFICPSGNMDKAIGTPAEQAAKLHQHCDYVYVGHGLTNRAPPTRVIAYERLDNHAGKGVSVVFADGHVEFLEPDAAARAIAGN